MVNFGPLATEIGLVVWGTQANFNGFRILAALLHYTLVVGVSQTFRHWTEGATYIRQGGHHVGHWPTCLVNNLFSDNEVWQQQTLYNLNNKTVIFLIKKPKVYQQTQSAQNTSLDYTWVTILLRMLHPQANVYNSRVYW